MTTRSSGSERTFGPLRPNRPSGPVPRALGALLLAALFLAAFLAPTFLAMGRGARVANGVFARTRVPKTPHLPRTTFLYDRQGHLLMEVHGAEDRTPIPFRQIPRTLREAATRDTSGITDWRAAMVNLRAHAFVEGGSTITQQYVKDVYTGDRRTVARKVREAIIALKLSRRYSKKEILARYLNEVYLGHGSYGVQAAAQRYFGKAARNLSLLQSATLAGIIAAPSQFDPISNPKDAKGRRNYVLKAMARLGFVSHRTAARLSALPVRTASQQRPPIPAQYFLSYVRKGLEHEFGTRRTFEGGLRVRTSLDLKLATLADRARVGLSFPVFGAGRNGGLFRVVVVVGIAESEDQKLYSCVVRQAAQTKMHNELERIRKLKADRPGIRVGLAGCMVEDDVTALSRTPFARAVLT